MYERIVKNPLPTIIGLVLGSVQAVALSESGFTWRGFGLTLGTTLLGMFTKQ